MSQPNNGTHSTVWDDTFKRHLSEQIRSSIDPSTKDFYRALEQIGKGELQ